MTLRSCQETISLVDSELVESIPDKLSTPLDQQACKIRKRRCFKDRSQRDCYPIMVKSKLRIGRLLTKKIKCHNVEASEQQQKQGRQHYPSLIDEMPHPPHNTTQYIIQVSHSKSESFLDNNLCNGFFDQSADSIDSHGMLGSMRGIFSFEKTCLFKDMSNDLMDLSPTVRRSDNAMEVEESMEQVAQDSRKVLESEN